MKNASKKICALVACIFSFTYASNGAITLSINYDLDTNGFFADGDGSTAVIKKAALEAAAFDLQSILTDSLTAITPDGAVNIFNTYGFHPATGVEQILESNKSILADQLVIYAGGRTLAGDTLGQGGPGGYSFAGSAAFKDNLFSRGEAGITDGAGNQEGVQTDFAPWGGDNHL